MRIHHLALRVADPERSLAFYAGVLGLGELRRDVQAGTLRAVWLGAGDTILMLERRLRGPGAAEGSSHVLAFAVDALDPWEEKLTAAGYAVDDRTSHTLYFRDPDRHRVALSTYRIR